MKQIVVLVICLLSFSSCADKSQRVTLELQSTPWSFATEQVAASTLTREEPRATFVTPVDTGSFTIKLSVNLPQPESKQLLFTIPGIVELAISQHDPNDRNRQNYPAYPMPDGSVPKLEANLLLQWPVGSGELQPMAIGIPLAMLDQPDGEHEVVLHFSGVRWTMYVDNELVDNDFPLGYPAWGANNSWEIDPQLVSKVELFLPGIEPQKVQLDVPRTSSEIQYWTPQGHNAWVGDVATFFHEGRYHLFYLYDRRGHASKFGRGAHYFEHLSTADFKTWTEHPAATPIEAQWETLGTGTPFVFNGQFCLSYGLHTTRIYPSEQTTLPLLWDYYHQHQQTGSFCYDTIPGYPAGSTYSISADGVTNFQKTHVLFHPCENPSVYTDPEGRLRMLANYGARGTWESSSIEGGWRSINPGFPPGGDCTFFFRWGDYDYVIGGFVGLWSKRVDEPEDSYTSVVERGLDFYNGMSVPAVTEINDGRFLMAGWIPMVNWGGTLNIHEMIQYPDGRIGTKWMEEIIPATQKPRTLAREVKEDTTFEVKEASFLLTFEVDPGENLSDQLGVVLLGADADHHACEMQINPLAGRAQYGDGSRETFAQAERSLREGGAPQSARNYAIEQLIDTDRPFTVRMIVKYDHKYGGSQVDTEIAGQRTMISYRPGLKVEKLLLRTEQTGISKVKIATLK